MKIDKADNDELMNAKHRNLKMFWYTIALTEQWKPPTREGCAMFYMENLHQCLIYGGIGRDLFSTMIVLNTRSWQWSDIGHG